MKKVIQIASINEVGGRVLLRAPGVVNNTSVAIFLDKQPTAWGTAKVTDEMALVVGRSPLPATYSLRVTAYPVRPKLLEPVVPEPADESADEAPANA